MFKYILPLVLAFNVLSYSDVLDYGTRQASDVVQSRSQDTYTESFVGNESARVFLSGDGDTDLDLYIFDFNGNEICRSTTSYDDEYCTWTPAWTGRFKIVVKNYGNVPNAYTLSLQ